ncbi:hypothetical protein BASA83_001247 [Batrachochytrium salamandrivorans]|nr:hypothetical protein BASA83_001247 [Batrachochytrium salamandrivorans]
MDIGLHHQQQQLLQTQPLPGASLHMKDHMWASQQQAHQFYPKSSFYPPSISAHTQMTSEQAKSSQPTAISSHV